MANVILEYNTRNELITKGNIKDEKAVDIAASDCQFLTADEKYIMPFYIKAETAVGNVAVQTYAGQDRTLVLTEVGKEHLTLCKKVYKTGTDATGLKALL